MQWHEMMNAAIAYIEANLKGDVDIWEAARIARCSEYHFRRMFAFVAGVSVSEYIRRRRLTLAAMDLYERRGGTKEISLRYGYRSPDSFARAFSAMHGISPATAIEGKIAYTTWPRMTFYLTIKGGSGMDVRLENKSDFNIVGFTKRIPILFEGVNPEIQSMVNSLSDDDWALLDHLSDTEPRGIVQAMTNYDESRMNGNGSCDYYIGTATTRHSHGDLTVLQVPATTWAIFRSIGLFPQALQETWGRIYSEWFPSVEYELNDGPELLRTEHDELTDEDMVWEIWIPVRKTT